MSYDRLVTFGKHVLMLSLSASRPTEDLLEECNQVADEALTLLEEAMVAIDKEAFTIGDVLGYHLGKDKCAEYYDAVHGGDAEQGAGFGVLLTNLEYAAIYAAFNHIAYLLDTTEGEEAREATRATVHVAHVLAGAHMGELLAEKAKCQPIL